uniref:uncharacterized protein LOC122594413 n=1 Tax=Erigeron canadensis TaxID=72917 RepID=UPI001CB940BF|nr:uncharacterized protein LOC122594413 [Erigeron canadensis]
MDNYNYNSYAESGESSPRSRDVDFDHTQPWEDQSATNNNYRVKFMCSYGGKILPRPHDNQLSYVGGETKILAVDRLVKYNVVISKLTTLCDNDVFFKYQLPGEDLDALISVTNDDDLEHMMHEFDRLSRASATPARLRLFLFPVSGQSPALTPVHSFGSTEGKTDRDRDRDRFMDALNTGHGQPTMPITAQQQTHGNNEHMFHPHNEMMHQPQINHQVMNPQDQKIAVINDCASEANQLQKHIEDLQRLQIAEDQQQPQPLPPGLYRKPSDDNLAACYTENNYAQKMMEKVTNGYQVSQEQQQQQQQPMYMIQNPASMYHQVPVARPSHGQGYYVQRMPHDLYRDQQNFNMPPLVAAPQAVATQQTTVSSQQQFLPPKVATYTEGYQMVQSTTAVTDQAYGQVAYDNMTGRQVYYTTQGAVLAQPQQQLLQTQQQLQPSVQQYQTMAVASGATVTISTQDNGAKVVTANNMKEFI